MLDLLVLFHKFWRHCSFFFFFSTFSSLLFILDKFYQSVFRFSDSFSSQGISLFWLLNFPNLKFPLSSFCCCCCPIAKSCSTLCGPTDHRTPGFSILHYLPEFAQIPIHWVDNAIQPSHPLLFPSSTCFQSFPASGSLPMSQFFTSGCRSIEASTSAPDLPMNIQCWFPLGLTGLISLKSKGLSRVFSSTTIQKHQFFGA